MKRLAYLGFFLLPFFFENRTLAAVAHFASGQKPELLVEGLYWSAQPFEVETQVQAGKEIRVAKLKAIFTKKDWNLTTTRSEKAVFTEAKNIVWDQFIGKPKEVSPGEENSYRLVSLEVVLADDAPMTHIQLISISPNGEAQPVEFDISVEETSKTYWDNRVQLSIPFGFYNNTSLLGSSTVFTLVGNAFELKGEASFFKAIHNQDRAIEVYASGSLGYMLSSSNLNFPIYWRGAIQGKLRNYLGSAQNGGNHGVSPLLGLEVETFPVVAPIVAATVSEQAYQMRSLFIVWATGGFKYRFQNKAWWWELIPTFSYSIRATSSLSVSGGSFNHPGWKTGLKAFGQIYRSLYGGIDGSYFNLNGDLQITGLTCATVIGIKF